VSGLPGGVTGQTGDQHEDVDSQPSFDRLNLEACKAFIDAKKKLRLVLSNADLQVISSSHSASPAGSAAFKTSAPSSTLSGVTAVRVDTSGASGDHPPPYQVVLSKETELVLFLKMHLAEAINLQDKDLVARLHETIRCLRLFDQQQVKNHGNSSCRFRCYPRTH